LECNLERIRGSTGVESAEIIMKMENAIRILAGTMVLISVTLAHFVSPWWLLLAVFVGCNLIQSAFTGFCPAEIIFRKLGIGKGAGCGCATPPGSGG
jgi:hypothetical protein